MSFIPVSYRAIRDSLVGNGTSSSLRARTASALPSQPRIGPGIQQRHPRLPVIRHTPRHHREIHDAPLRPRSAQLGEDVRIEEPAGHRVTSRTGMTLPGGSRSTSPSGAACIAATRAEPSRSPWSRWNSSAEITTTSSEDCDDGFDDGVLWSRLAGRAQSASPRTTVSIWFRVEIALSSIRPMISPPADHLGLHGRDETPSPGRRGLG